MFNPVWKCSTKSQNQIVDKKYSISSGIKEKNKSSISQKGKNADFRANRHVRARWASSHAQVNWFCFIFGVFLNSFNNEFVCFQFPSFKILFKFEFKFWELFDFDLIMSWFEELIPEISWKSSQHNDWTKLTVKES